MRLGELLPNYLSLRPAELSPEEWTSMFYWLTEAFSDCSRFEYHLQSQRSLTEQEQAAYMQAFEKLAEGIPVQYVLGRAYFCDHWFSVSPATLIPRPETEELVDWIVSDAVGQERILDIGTGSGCIAISLADRLPGAEVSGLDISEAALEVAKDNARSIGVSLRWMHLDILEQVPPGKYDIIVSNPPYVTQREKEQMRPNVLDFEPHTALFVPDEDPLLFYERIAVLSSELLAPHGWVYLEINEYLGNEVVSLMEKEGFSHVELRKDFLGKDRFVKCRL